MTLFQQSLSRCLPFFPHSPFPNIYIFPQAHPHTQARYKQIYMLYLFGVRALLCCLPSFCFGAVRACVCMCVCVGVEGIYAGKTRKENGYLIVCPVCVRNGTKEFISHKRKISSSQVNEQKTKGGNKEKKKTWTSEINTRTNHIHTWVSLMLLLYVIKSFFLHYTFPVPPGLFFSSFSFSSLISSRPTEDTSHTKAPLLCTASVDEKKKWA